MPEVSSFYGILIYMYMSEHNPPHFHVKYQEYEAIITIEGGVVTGTLPRRALNLVLSGLISIRMNLCRIGREWRIRRLS